MRAESERAAHTSGRKVERGLVILIFIGLFFLGDRVFRRYFYWSGTEPGLSDTTAVTSD